MSQPWSFTDYSHALDAILRLAVEKGLDLSDITRFSAFVREQLVIRQEVERLAEARHQATIRETHRAVRGLVPIDVLDCDACPPRGAPYQADVLRVEDMDALDAAQEIRG